MGAATDKCRNAVMLLGFTHPHFLLIHQKLRDLYQEDPKGGGPDGVGTMGISNNGKIYINPEFVMALDKEELGGVLAHEMLHLVLTHHSRRGNRDPWIWNIATDMCINKALMTDNIRLTKGAYYPPAEYKGDLYAEALFEWLQQNPKYVPQKGQGMPAPGQGCAVIDEGDGKQNQPGQEGEGIDWRAVAMEARAVAQTAGRGTSGVAALLAPRQQKINWKKVIRHGFELACAKIGRDWQTFAKRHRRSPVEGAQLPGWLGYDPRIGIIIDVSGSMDREWLSEIVAEIKGLMKSFQGVKVYLITHTSEVVWEGWVDQSTQAKLAEAVSFSGGTDPYPAYAAMKKAGKFDTIIHFTDCEFGAAWPPVPAKNLVVGAFLRHMGTKPPPGAHVIPCGKDM